MNTPSIAMCANVYNDAPALRGLLELSARYFDNLFICHSGPGGAPSTDGTLELCREFGATVVLDDMQRGFGSIRSRLIHECGCDWAFILDADERFFPILPVLECEGTEFYPAVPSPGLKVTTCLDTLNQGLLLKDTIKDPNLMVVRSTRRHWFDFSMTRPTQNWLHRTDHQLRIVRNLPELDYKKSRVMHERLIDSRTGGEPRYAEQSNVTGPFHDHFHMHFRTQFPGKKEANEQNYSRLEKGEEMRA